MNIRIEHLYKAYKLYRGQGLPVQDEKVVLRDYSAELREGCWNIITGPSGCGKTTLLRILMGLEQADQGEVVGMHKRMAALFQEDRLCKGLSAVKNCMIVLSEKGAKKQSKKELEEKVQEHLNMIGLKEADMKQPVQQLSGGMKRRAALVRAVLADAPLLILDEPFQGLDEATVDQVLAYLEKYTKGKTLVLVTHEWLSKPAISAGRILEMKK